MHTMLTDKKLMFSIEEDSIYVYENDIESNARIYLVFDKKRVTPITV